MDGKEKPEKRTDRSGKLQEKRVVQRQLTLESVRNLRSSNASNTSDKRTQRTSSSDAEPMSPCTDISGELKLIQESLAEIRQSMVKKEDIKNIVTVILSEMKGEIKKEIISDVKESLTEEIIESVKTEVKSEFESRVDQKVKTFVSKTKEIEDGVNMDIANLREKLQEQLKELRSLQNTLKNYRTLTESALTLANHNQQYSQKNNIKFLGWKEKPQENLREELCVVMKQAANVNINPADILAIHRIPGAKGKIRPVIAKFKNAETKINVIRHRSKEDVKQHFMMFDHLTQRNAQLLRDLNNNEKIQSAWYFNGKIFGLDQKGIRHQYDIMDTVSYPVGS